MKNCQEFDENSLSWDWIWKKWIKIQWNLKTNSQVYQNLPPLFIICKLVSMVFTLLLDTCQYYVIKSILVFNMFWLLLLFFLASNAENITTDIFCFACGLKEIDPELDWPGSFGDSRLSWTAPGKKMYNYSCDIAHQMGLDNKWLRKCPHGVKSCFWSKTSYEDTS